MIIVFIIIVSLARFKQEITGDHLKYCTGQAPYISWRIIISTYNYLWRTILPSLNLWRKVMVCPAPVTHIAYLYHNVFVNFGTSLILTRLLSSIIRSTSIVELVIIIQKVSNRFFNTIKATFLCMTCLFLLFSCSLLWFLVFFNFLSLLFFITLLAFIITALFVSSCTTLILLLLSLLLFL